MLWGILDGMEAGGLVVSILFLGLLVGLGRVWCLS